MENRRKIKMAVIFMIIIFLFPLIFILSRKEKFSPEENRNLKEFPEVSPESILEKKFI